MCKQRFFAALSFLVMLLPAYAWSQSSPVSLIATTDQGTYRTEDNGRSWQSVSQDTPKICMVMPVMATPALGHHAKQSNGSAKGVPYQTRAFFPQASCQDQVITGGAAQALSDQSMYVKRGTGYSKIPLKQVVGAPVASVKMAQLSPSAKTLAIVFKNQQGVDQLGVVNAKTMTPRYQPVTLKVNLGEPQQFIFSQSQDSMPSPSTVMLASAAPTSTSGLSAPASLGTLVGSDATAAVMVSGQALRIIPKPGGGRHDSQGHNARPYFIHSHRYRSQRSNNQPNAYMPYNLDNNYSQYRVLAAARSGDGHRLITVEGGDGERSWSSQHHYYVVTRQYGPENNQTSLRRERVNVGNLQHGVMVRFGDGRSAVVRYNGKSPIQVNQSGYEQVYLPNSMMVKYMQFDTMSH